MNNLKRFLALMLAMCMMLTAVPFSAFAAESTEAPDSDVEALADDGTATASVTLGTKPADGEMSGEPFNDEASYTGSTTGHTNYRIPGMVMLNDGTLVASADIRYDYEYDGGGSDIVVSRSKDNGANWNYSVVAYLGDQGNVHAKNASTMMDPVLITDGEVLYLLYDMFPAGYSLGGGSNTTYAFSATGTGFDSEGRLLLGTSYNSTDCGYYLENGKIYASNGTEQAGYTVDAWFNVYLNNTYVSNLFFVDSPFYAYPTSYACIQKSDDGGESWSDPEMLKTKHDGTKWQVLGPGSGIVTSSGELAFTVYNSDSSISLVHGTSGNWTTVKTSAAVNESSVVELSDGTIRAFVKNDDNLITYVDFTKSGDSYTAGNAQSLNLVNTGWCMISSMVYSKKIDGKEVIMVCCPASSGLRRYGNVFAFTVDPTTKAMTKVGSFEIDTGYSDQFFAYSDMAELEDGTIALLYEDGCRTYASAPWNGSAAGSGYSHIALTNVDPEEDLGLTFDSDSTAAAKESISLGVGETVEIELNTNVGTGSKSSTAADVEWVGETVSVPYLKAQEGTSSSFDGNEIRLSECLYTFNKVSETDSATIWTISHEMEGGQKVYVNAHEASAIKNPNQDDAINVSISLSNYTNSVDGPFVFSGVGSSRSLHFHTENNGHYWNQCSSAHSYSGNGTHGLFILRLEGATLTSLTSMDQITPGEQYLIAGMGLDGTYYVMHPTTETNSQYAHVAEVLDTQGADEVSSTTITVTGKAVGTTTVDIGGTTYSITVNEKRDITLQTGESQTVVDETGNYASSYTGEGLNTNIATVTVTGKDAVTQTTVSATPATALEAGASYLVVIAGTNYAMTTNTGSGAWDTHTLALADSKTTASDVNTWTLEADGDGYKLKSAAGYLSLGTGENVANVGTTGETFTITQSNGNWLVGNSSGMYINALGGAQWYQSVGGYRNGTELEFYKVEQPSAASTEIVFKGVSVGTTSVVVGNTKYNITVRDGGKDIVLKVGETVTDVIDNAEYTMDDVNVEDPSIATIDKVEHIVTPGTTVINPVTEIVSGKQYLLVNTRANKTLTGTAQSPGLALNGAATADNTNVWTIETSGDAYTVRYGTDGGYLTVGNTSASLSSSASTVQLEYVPGDNYWRIYNVSNSNCCLNDYQGGHQIAAGWNDGSSPTDVGSKWQIYEVVTTPAETDTKVTITGHKVGQTTATVGGMTYYITVENDVRDITLHVGQTKTFYIDGYSYNAGSVVDSGIAKLDSVVPKTAKLVSVDEIVSGGQYLIVASQTGEVLTDTAITLTGDAGEKSALVTEGTASVDNTELWTITGDATNGYTIVQDGKYLTVAGYYAAMSTTATKIKLTHSASGWMICDNTTWESLNHNQADYYLRNGIADANYAADAMGSSITSSHSYWYIYKIDENPVTEVTFTGVKAGETTATVGHVTFNITVDTVVAGDISDFNNIVGKGTYSDDNANATYRSDLDMTGKPITSLRITEGAEFQLDVGVTDYESVTWKTDDASIATVDSTGMVTAVTEGQTFVTATVIKNGVEESIRIPVTVVPSLVEGYASSAVTSVFYYIERIDWTDPYYTMFLNTESTTEPVEGHRLVKVSEGEVIWYERPTNSAFAWVWTADPWEGYALTKMGSTGSINEYYPLRDVNDITKLGDGYVDVDGNGSFAVGTDSEYYYTSANFSGNGAPNNAYKNVVLVGNDGGASWRTELDALLNEAILVGINVYPNYGCDGAMSNTRWDHDGVPKLVTSMTFISDPMPHITKTVNGVLPTTRLRKDFKPYTDGMVATVGEYVYFQIDVTLERPTVWADEANGIGAITYTEAMVTDTVLPGAYFYAQANDTNMDGVISGDEVSEGTDVDITARLNDPWEEDEEVRKISLFLVYEIKNEDIPKFVIDNTANLAWKYQSHYSTGTLAGKADAKASITVVGYAMDNVVIDFGQKVVYTGLTDAHLKYVTLGEHQTKYGTAVVAGVGAEQDDGLGNKYYNEYTVTYTPNAILQAPDAVQLSGTYLDKENNKTVSKVINGFLVYPATTVYYEEGFMLNDASTGWSAGTKATVEQKFELLGKSVYNADKTLTGYESDKTYAYGYDPIYDAVDASKITQSTATTAGAATTFTFTGTGFDLYANSTEETGAIAVQVRNAANEVVKMYTVNTKVGEATAAEVKDSTDGQSGSMYSLPVISEQGLAHGTYTVKIMKIQGGDVNLDGIRIFNTFDESPFLAADSKAESPFAIDLEDAPEFYQLRDYVLSAMNIADNTSLVYGKLNEMAEQVYGQISSDSEAPYAVVLANGTYNSDVQNLLDNGPKNEIYLHAGETLVFSVKTSRAIQIGLKAPVGKTSYSVAGAGNGISGDLSSTVDMFYALNNTIGTENTYTITITNTGDKILSVTDLKICDDPNAALVPLTAEGIKSALATMGYGIAENTTTGESYETLSAALSAAKSGETVKLLADCTESTVMVTPGVTLDLNGCKLTASYAVAMNTAHVVDNAGSGCLVIGMESLVLDEANAMIPVYNGEGYVFTLAGFAIRQDTAYTGEGVKIQAVACPVNMDVVELLRNGGADNNVEIMIRMSWDGAQGTTSQEFKFTDDIVASVYSSNQGNWYTYGQMFSMVVTGFENIENLKANIVVVSGTDAEYASDTSIDIT